MAETIRLIDGEGGRATSRLVKKLFLERFANPSLSMLTDSAIVEVSSKRIAFTTDSFVVDPLEFPGGDIGKLSICGTINDLSAMGARPLFISTSFIIEEGLSLDKLARYVDSMALIAREAGVEIVCGDTKVVPIGKADKLFITTSGVGVLPDTAVPMPSRISPGDSIIVSGDIARHASAIVALREKLKAEPPIESDCAPLGDMIQRAIREVPEISAMRDPTRGGLGGALLELSAQSGTRFVIYEKEIPIEKPVENLCELYGFDPLFMACEGRMIIIVPEKFSSKLLDMLKDEDYGKGARIIGKVVEGDGVVIETRAGGTRKIIAPEGAPLPRIC